MPTTASAAAISGETAKPPNSGFRIGTRVGNVRKLGMKYMVWFGVPFIGYSREAYGRSKGKYLNDVKNLYCASLDPRFPEVREYLIET